MSVESALAAELEDSAEVASVVSTRVYRTEARPGAPLPYIVIEMDGGRGHAGHAGGAASLTHRRGMIVCYETTATLVEALATVVRKVVDAFHGVLGSGSHTASVSRLSLLAPIEDFIAPTDGSSAGKHGRRIPFELWLQEA